MKKVLIIFSIISFVFSSAAFAAQEVKIGLVAPLTGDQAYVGTGLLNGATMAVEDANASGTLPEGMALKLEALDDQRNPTQAVLAANKLVADAQVVAVMGHFNSSCTKAASSIYHEAKLPQVTAASTNPDISKQGFDTFFRVCATDDVQGPAAASFVAEKLNVKTVIVIDDQTTYGKGLADQFQATFIAKGGKVLKREGITQGEKDYTPLLTKLKIYKPELVFFGGVYPELALLLKQAPKVGLRCLWMGGDGVFDTTLISLATPALSQNVYAAMLGVDPKSLPAAAEFVKRYETRFGPIGSFSAYAYDATNVIIDAIRQSGQPDRLSVLRYLSKTKDFPGILGPINFDEKGDAIGKSVGIFKVDGDKFTFLEEIKPQS